MSRADINQSDIVKALRSVGATVHILSQAGEGCPDLLIGIFGKNHLMEVKNPEKHWKLTTKQIIFHDTWKGKVHVVESVNDALKAIGVDI